MLIAVIGEGKKNHEITKELERAGKAYTVYEPESINSLVTLVLSEQKIHHLVFLQGVEKCWSMGHILAAAKQLQGRGYVIFISPQNKPPALIRTAETGTELVKLLTNPVSSSAGGDDSSSDSGGRVIVRGTPILSRRSQVVKPIKISPEQVLILGVTGTQPRIGCTTQAVGLWHYCKALGYNPAIVAAESQIETIARPMKSVQIRDGYEIEGIPFITNTQQAYDCYICDFGSAPAVQVSKREDLDCLILVGGIKPWEIINTVTALSSLSKILTTVLISFADEKGLAPLMPLFRQEKLQHVATTPWMPNLWQPNQAALAAYDRLLRPVLENVMTNDEKEIEYAQQ